MNREYQLSNGVANLKYTGTYKSLTAIYFQCLIIIINKTHSGGAKGARGGHSSPKNIFFQMNYKPVNKKKLLKKN